MISTINKARELSAGANEAKLSETKTIPKFAKKLIHFFIKSPVHQ